MTIQFEEQKITSKEKITRKPFVGYFSPNGELIELGEDNHKDLNSSIENTFLSFITFVTDDELLNEYRGINDIFMREYNYSYDYNTLDIDSFLSRLNNHIKYIKNSNNSNNFLVQELEYKLMQFFLKAYKNKSFFDTIGKKIVVENRETVRNTIKSRILNIDDNSLQILSFNHLKKELLSYFKDICVEYLRYDSIERFDINRKLIKIPESNHNYFLENPRIITSSYPNINERFFNYLIMDWHIRRVSRFRYNEITEKFEEEDSSSLYYQSDSEEMLAEEIKSIKRKVPIKERYKYFR